MEQRDERIIVETARYRITGLLHLPKDGYRSRLTDYLNAAERTFLPLTDVEIGHSTATTAGSERRSFVALSLNQIVIAMPADANVYGDDVSCDRRETAASTRVSFGPWQPTRQTSSGTAP